MGIKRTLMVVALSSTALGTTGCTVLAEIKPSELPKIGVVSMTPAVSQSTGRADVVAMSVARVERTDGRVLEVSGRPNVWVTCRGAEREYEHPVTSTIEGTTVQIASSNYAKNSCDLADVSSVRVVDVPATNTRTMVVSLSSIALELAAAALILVKFIN